ncbi:hypothetical protein V2J09_014292 [Rumex salicifolius]
MGQAFRRAAGRLRSSSLDTSASSPSQPAHRRPTHPPSPSPVGGVVDKVDGFQKPLGEVNSDDKLGIGLEDRDPKFNEMLNQMVGRINTKPGGKFEMGEAFVVEKYNRPMPKLRNTNPDSGRYEDRATPPGTLNVAQLRHIMLLYQGKAEDHDGPVSTKDIAARFRLDASQIEKILQFVSLPPEDTTKTKQLKGSSN